MLKKSVFILIFCLMTITIFSFSIAQISPENPDVGGDISKVQDIVSSIPIDDQGNFDPGTMIGWKSKSEIRIEELNSWVGPISKILFGVELSMSWIFLYTLVLWLVLWEFVRMPFNAFIENQWLALLVGVIIATISMHSWGPNLVTYIDTMLTVWWMALIAVIGAIIATFFLYPMWMKRIKKSLEAARKERVKIAGEETIKTAEIFGKAREELAKKE